MSSAKDNCTDCSPDGLPPDTQRIVAKYRQTLVALPLFAGIPDDLLEQFLYQCEYRCIRSWEQLLSPGQVNLYLYVLLSGQLNAHVNEHEADKGFRILPGEFVGEVSIVDNQPPTSYVTAALDSLLLCIPESLLWAEFIMLPEAARNMLKQIIKRVRARNQAVQKSLEQALRLEMLDKELLIAQQLQTSMLPQPPLFPGMANIDAAAFMLPAKVVGGDLYDAFVLDERRICFAIGDVAGKGIPAALFMMRSITVLRSEMMLTKDLRQTMRAVNNTLSQDNPHSMFVTLMVCVLDLHSGELQYANGGHNRPLLGSPAQGFYYLEQPKGILMGIAPDAEYEVARHSLQPGDMLVLYTDGVTEACNPAQAEFSEPGLLDFMNQRQALSAGAALDGILAAVQEFAAGAEQSDDLTLLVVRYP